MTIVETRAARLGVSFDQAAVLINFQTAYNLAKLGFSISPSQTAGTKAKVPSPGLPWKPPSTWVGLDGRTLY